MPTFASYDSTVLAYHVRGAGPPLVCFPGGPGLASEYLGDLGRLTERRTLLVLDSRGTGDSAVPADPSSYRLDRQVADVEAFRLHLGREKLDVLGHSAGTAVVSLYAAQYPHRIVSLTLVAPSSRFTGLPPHGVSEARAARAGEPWYEDAAAALAELDELDDDAPDEVFDALEARIEPFGHGRWDDAARALAAAARAQFAAPARAGYYAGYQPDPAMLARLADVTAPVLVIAGELDALPSRPMSTELAARFPNSRYVSIPGGGHFPWMDNPAAFRAAFN